MAQDQSLNQDDVNAVWSSVWKKTTPDRNVFKNRLFIEGYRTMQSYIPRDARRFLEIGTGSGRYGIAFARDFPGLEVVATDVVPEALNAARQLAQDAGIHTIQFETENGEHLSYENSSFDAVFSDAVIQHMPHEEQAVREMSRVVKTGGVVIIAVVNRWSIHAFVRAIQRLFGYRNEYGSEKFYSHIDLRRLMQDAGLRVEVETGFYPAYGIYRLKRYAAVFGVLGRGMNKITHFLDAISGGFVSKTFGFEIVAVGRKPDGGSS